jgi:hypothetical protein
MRCCTASICGFAYFDAVFLFTTEPRSARRILKV